MIPVLKQRNLGISMRASIDSIKAELGNGQVVTRARQQGKTTALLEFIHEYCSGFCYVVTCNWSMAELIGHRYRQLFPEDEQPICIPFQRLRGHGAGIQGRPRAWVTDEIWPDAAEIADRELETLTFLGGVGTPYCMDMHST